MVADAVRGLGYHLGATLLPPNDENPKGFFENAAIVHLNDELLWHMEVAWDSLGFIWNVDFDAAEFEPFRKQARAVLASEFPATGNIAIKDPRLCLLAPFWRRVLEEHGYTSLYVVVVRNPLECARSQQRRHAADPDFHVVGKHTEQMLLLWYTYLRKALTAIGDGLSAIVSYKGLIANPDAGLENLAAFLGTTLGKSSADYGHIISHELKRCNATLEDLQRVEPDGGFVSQLFVGLAELSDHEPPVKPGQFEKLLAEVPSFAELLPLYQRQTERLHGMAYHTAISLRDRLIAVVDELGTTKGQVDRLSSELANQEEVFSRCQETVFELREDKTRLEIDNNQLQQDIGRLERHSAEVERQLANLESRYANLERTFSAVVNRGAWRWTTLLRRLLRS